MIAKTLHRAGVRSGHLEVVSMGSVGLCVALWIRAKTVDQDERGNAERRALFVGLWPPTIWLIGDSLRAPRVRWPPTSDSCRSRRGRLGGARGPGGYGYWVVGSKVIRDADPAWPAPGTRFHHTIGVGPLKVSDHTESLEAEPPRLLRMRAKGRPLGTARVTMEMTPLRRRHARADDRERPTGRRAMLALNPLVHLLTKARNAESLMRLEELALRRRAMSVAAVPSASFWIDTGPPQPSFPELDERRPRGRRGHRRRHRRHHDRAAAHRGAAPTSCCSRPTGSATA